MKLTVVQIARRTFSDWNADEAPRLGAALAFYSIMSMGPLLLIVISVAGMVVGHDAASGAILAQMRALVGEEGAQLISDVLTHSQDQGKNIVATVIGVVTLLVSVSGFFAQLQGALNIIFNAPKVTTTVWQFVLQRVLSFGMVVGICLLLLVSLAVSAGLSAITAHFQDSAPVMVVGVVSFLFSLLITTLLFTLTFKVLPDVSIGWRIVWPGALMTALLFTIGKSLIGLYLGQSALSSTYGAAGSLIVLLVWVYYSTQIIFFGAEFTQVWAEAKGRAFTVKKGWQKAPKAVAGAAFVQKEGVEERGVQEGGEAQVHQPSALMLLGLRVAALVTLVGLSVLMKHRQARRLMNAGQPRG